jgi:hypothetical protein
VLDRREKKKMNEKVFCFALYVFFVLGFPVKAQQAKKANEGS